ncbi:hypothetical protein [Actinoallomurus iriomotensis]|uniref:Uncharacterized protein n=1 Tax=Actinoallomurus iriomotensis TaxID=478107 RepID=A0A9W6S6V3_9ACTN|nr:hypothetical protein [Actinoallomurus iriomotensis]GLY88261.1 hypothetical protein Airi02_061900 [Actinoallomurus iriomotensis]
MLQNGQKDFAGTLIEPQGVNAGDAIDAEHALVPHGNPRPDPPTPPSPSELLPDEMVGLPEQIPGYPGQQRSVETS